MNEYVSKPYTANVFPVVDFKDVLLGIGIIVQKSSMRDIDISNFMSSLVHDLKNPVNSIIGIAQIMELTRQNDNYAGYIARVAKKLITLIDVASRPYRVFLDCVDVGI